MLMCFSGRDSRTLEENNYAKLCPPILEIQIILSPTDPKRFIARPRLACARLALHFLPKYRHLLRQLTIFRQKHDHRSGLMSKC
jgi:hypothetical protein